MPDTKRLVCNKAKTCEEALHCGGARPHTKLGCEPCPFDRMARCVPEADEGNVCITAERDAVKVASTMGYTAWGRIGVGGIAIEVPRDEAEIMLELIQEAGYRAKLD